MKNEIVTSDVKYMFYKIRCKQVMLASEISRTKSYNYFYDMMITHYDIGEPISLFDDYVIV